MTVAFPLPEPPARVHFVGIGGIGMSGLARMLVALGYEVSGSDAAPSALIDSLRMEGFEVLIGHDDVRLSRDADVVVCTAAVNPGNPEIAAALETGVPVIKRARLLGAIALPRRCIAVAGTHGKSTTSAMLASALMALGKHPSYAVGAILQLTCTNAAIGSGPDIVVEADEYDRSFLELAPDVAVITNLEFDHPDIFPTMDDYTQAFAEFASQIRPGGTLVIRGDDPGCQALLNRLGAHRPYRISTFGKDPGCDWSLRTSARGWLVAGPGGQERELNLRVPGEHNALNATAAIAALVTAGVTFDEAVAAVDEYQGIDRRFEIKGEEGGVLIVDDYAHHPSEIEATLAAAASAYPNRRIWAVFQPHTFSRTRALLGEFTQALGQAGQRMVLDVYGARETNDGAVTEADMLRMAGPGGLRAENLNEACEKLSQVVKPGDLVLTLGAGSITALGPMLIERLSNPESGAAGTRY